MQHGFRLLFLSILHCIEFSPRSGLSLQPRALSRKDEPSKRKFGTQVRPKECGGGELEPLELNLLLSKISVKIRARDSKILYLFCVLLSLLIIDFDWTWRMKARVLENFVQYILFFHLSISCSTDTSFCFFSFFNFFSLLLFLSFLCSGPRALPGHHERLLPRRSGRAPRLRHQVCMGGRGCFEYMCNVLASRSEQLSKRWFMSGRSYLFLTRQSFFMYPLYFYNFSAVIL